MQFVSVDNVIARANYNLDSETKYNFFIFVCNTNQAQYSLYVFIQSTSGLTLKWFLYKICNVIVIIQYIFTSALYTSELLIIFFECHINNFQAPGWDVGPCGLRSLYNMRLYIIH